MFEKHHIFTEINTFRAVANVGLSAINAQYFCWQRFYRQGGYTLLASDTSIAEYFLFDQRHLAI